MKQPKSLNDLKVGTFVRESNGNTRMWNGRTLCLVDPLESEVDAWDISVIGFFKGFRYRPNSDHDIVAYSDSYRGIYTPISQESESQRKVRELEETITKAQEQIKQLKKEV